MNMYGVYIFFYFKGDFVEVEFVIYVVVRIYSFWVVVYYYGFVFYL